VDSVRRVIAALGLTNRFAGMKMVVVQPAEAMTTQAVNTLLKTLEEPPGACLFVLVAHRHALLPATVRSRCQFLDFQLPDPAAASAWLRGELGAAVDVSDLLRQARGAPLRALRLAKTDHGNTFKQVSDTLVRLCEGDRDPLQIAENWRKDGIEVVTTGLVSFAEDLIRIKMRLAPVAIPDRDTNTLQAIAGRLDFKTLYSLLDRCIEARRAVIRGSGLNELLLLEDLACAWGAERNR